VGVSEVDVAVEMLDDAFARRDLEAVLSFYEDDAVVVVEPGRLARGKVEITRFFQFLFTLNGRAEQLQTNVIECGETALFTSRWRFVGTSPGGVPFEKEAVATSVFRRNSGGNWRMVIDNSHGPAVLSDRDA
jgi:ketosteroid isomerase-like protein